MNKQVFKSSPFGRFVKPFERPLSVHSDKIDKYSVLRTPSAVDDLLIDNIGDKKNPAYVVHSDIYFLFNQKRLEYSLGTNAASDYVKSLYNANGYTLPDGVSDEDIFSTIKSRYIQSPCELKAYIDSLGSRAKNLVQKAVDEAVAKHQSNSEQTVAAQPAVAASTE